MKQFAFFPSTPKAQVGEAVLQGFLQKGSKEFGPLQIPYVNYKLQEYGVKPVFDVYLPIKNKGSRFVSLAAFPEEMIDQERSISHFTSLLRSNYLIRNTTVQEFISRLKGLFMVTLYCDASSRESYEFLSITRIFQVDFTK
jgi:hypothetical protein